MKTNLGNFFFKNKKTSALFVSTLIMTNDDPPDMPMSCEGDPQQIHCSYVSWRECGSCEGFMLCMSCIKCLFVFSLCRPVEDVAFV